VVAWPSGLTVPLSVAVAGVTSLATFVVATGGALIVTRGVPVVSSA